MTDFFVGLCFAIWRVGKVLSEIPMSIRHHMREAKREREATWMQAAPTAHECYARALLLGLDEKAAERMANLWKLANGLDVPLTNRRRA